MPLQRHLEASSSSFLKCARNHSTEDLAKRSPAEMYMSAGRISFFKGVRSGRRSPVAQPDTLVMLQGEETLRAVCDLSVSLTASRVSVRGQRAASGRLNAALHFVPKLQIQRRSSAEHAIGVRNPPKELLFLHDCSLRVGANRQTKRGFPSQQRSSHRKIKKASLMNARCQLQRGTKTKSEKMTRFERQIELHVKV